MNMFMINFLFAVAMGQEGSGQVPDNEPAELARRQFGRPNRPSDYSYDEYGEADLGMFMRDGSPFTSCRVGSYNTRNSPHSSVDCATGEVCQITFEYRRTPNSFKRFYRAQCKEQKTCEVRIRFCSNQISKFYFRTICTQTTYAKVFSSLHVYQQPTASHAALETIVKVLLLMKAPV